MRNQRRRLGAIPLVPGPVRTGSVIYQMLEMAAKEIARREADANRQQDAIAVDQRRMSSKSR